MFNRFGRVVALLVLAALSGCGGGGGPVGVGNARPSPGSSPTPFSSFRNIQPDQTVDMIGFSQTVSATTVDGVVISDRTADTVQTGSRIELFHDSNLQPTVISIHTARASLIWSGSTQIACGTELCLMGHAQTLGGLANAMGGLGWNYQTFGYWFDSPTLNTRELGAISTGSQTPPEGVPTNATATYTGLAAGLYVDPTGAVFEHVASMSALADFGAARSLTFTTTRTAISSLQGGLATSAPEFDLAGTLTIVPGSNQFAGTLTTADTRLSGDATGRFYGPAAEEIGGVFTLLPAGGAGVETMNGAFGARR
jgi:hypothetical protein